VLELRRRSERDIADSSHLARCDLAAVALYSTGSGVGDELGIARGVVRVCDVREAPPRTGLPVVSNTMSMEEFADSLLAGAIAGTAASDKYGPAEGDQVLDGGASALEDVVSAVAAEEVDELRLEE